MEHHHFIRKLVEDRRVTGCYDRESLVLLAALIDGPERIAVAALLGIDRRSVDYEAMRTTPHPERRRAWLEERIRIYGSYAPALMVMARQSHRNQAVDLAIAYAREIPDIAIDARWVVREIFYRETSARLVSRAASEIQGLT